MGTKDMGGWIEDYRWLRQIAPGETKVVAEIIAGKDLEGAIERYRRDYDLHLRVSYGHDEHGNPTISITRET